MTQAKKIVTSFIVCATFLTPGSLWISQVSAQSSVAAVEENLTDPQGNIGEFELTAIPPRIEIHGKPGETIQKTIKVKNGTKSTQYISSGAEDFIIDTDGKTPIPVDGKEGLSERFSLASWLTVSPTRFSLRPNQTQVLDVLIQIPRDALPGGHYAMVLHEKGGTTSFNPNEGGSKGSASIATRVGSLLYVIVDGPINEEAYIRNLKVPTFQEYGPVSISFEVENRSDIHIRPSSSVEIYDLFGQKIFTSKVDEKNIFPFSVREFSSDYGAYWGLGRYTAKVVTSYGDAGRVTQAAAYFWIVPYTLIIGILIFLLCGVSLWIAIRRHLIHRNDTKTQEIEYLKKRVQELEEKK